MSLLLEPSGFWGWWLPSIKSNFIGAIKYFTILCVHFLLWICLWLSLTCLRGTYRFLCKMSDASTMHRRIPVSCSWILYRGNAHTGRIIHSNASETTMSRTWFFCLNMCWIAKHLQTLHKAQWSGKKTLFLQSGNIKSDQDCFQDIKLLTPISRNRPSRLH